MLEQLVSCSVGSGNDLLKLTYLWSSGELAGGACPPHLPFSLLELNLPVGLAASPLLGGTGSASTNYR